MANEIQPYEIVLEGEFVAGVTAKAFLRELDLAAQRPLMIYLNSPGGNVGEAHQILAALDTYPAMKRIHIDGVALSAAMFIVCTANAYVSIVPHGIMMIHRCSLDAGKVNADALRGDLTTLNTCDLTALKVIQRRLKLPAAQIESMLSAETWFSSTEALALGLVDAVVRDLNETTKPLALGKFKNVAPVKKDSELEKILEKIRKQVAGDPAENVESLLKQIRDLLTGGGAGDKTELENLRAAYRETWAQSAGAEFRNTAGNSYPQKPNVAQLQRDIFNQVSGGR